LPGSKNDLHQLSFKLGLCVPDVKWLQFAQTSSITSHNHYLMA
jgi:hypothetical protein